LVSLERLMGEGGPLERIRFEAGQFSRLMSERYPALARSASDAEALFAQVLESSIGELWTARFVEQARGALSAALEGSLTETDRAAVALGLSTLERVASRHGSDPLLCPISPLAFRLQLRTWLDEQRRLDRQLGETAAELEAGAIEPAEAARRLEGAGPKPPAGEPEPSQ
jgi:hypothetical protein